MSTKDPETVKVVVRCRPMNQKEIEDQRAHIVDMDLESVLISEGLVCSCPAAKAYRGSVRRQRWLGTEASEMRVSLSTRAESLNAQVDFDNLWSYFAFFIACVDCFQPESCRRLTHAML